MFYLDFCPHAQWRAAQRGLTAEEVEYVLLYGQRFHKGGALIVYLAAKDLPRGDARRPFCTRLIGTAVVMDTLGHTVLTVWRNRDGGLKHIRRKPDYRLNPPPWLLEER